MMRRSAFALTALLLLAHAPAFAHEPALQAVSTAAEAKAEPSLAAFEPSPEPAATTNPTPGIVVVLASLAAGVALTSYGLTVDCGELDHACHRRAAAPIWGGVGLAAVGSLVGLRLMQSSGSRSAALVTVHGTF